jgi:hypothetical protein
MVEMTPATSAQIKPIFAQSYRHDAISNDGHIRLPFWFPISATGIVFSLVVFL